MMYGNVQEDSYLKQILNYLGQTIQKP